MKREKMFILIFMSFLILGFILPSGVSAYVLSMEITNDGTNLTTDFWREDDLILNIAFEPEPGDTVGVACCAFSLQYPADILTAPVTDGNGIPIIPDSIMSPFPFSYNGDDTHRENTGSGRIYFAGAAIDTVNGGAIGPATNVFFTVSFTVKSDAAIGNGYLFELLQTEIFDLKAGYGTDSNQNGVYDEGVDTKDSIPVLLGAVDNQENGWDNFDCGAGPCAFPVLMESIDPAVSATFNVKYPDSDNDGVVDNEDDFPNDPAASVDTDNDGKPDKWNPGKTQADSTSDPKLVLDDDDDNDGMPDTWEEQYGFNPVVDDAADDLDEDGITNLNEYEAGTDPTLKNRGPTADAGSNQTVDEAESVTLDSSNSSDPDNDIVAYLWEQVDGPTVMLSDTTVITPIFTAPDVAVGGASLTFKLTVTDNGGLEDTDVCLVNVIWQDEHAPVANAGADQTVGVGQVVTLDGSGSSDPDAAEGDGIAAYMWEQTDGSVVELSDNTVMQPTFTAPDIEDEGVALTFKLTVEDSGGLRDNDTCIVNVTKLNLTPPVADAGDDQAVVEGKMVILDGSGSSDEDGTIIGYLWTQTDGTPVMLSYPRMANPIFKAPDIDENETLVFQLTVTDDDGLKAEDTVEVLVKHKKGGDGGCFIKVLTN